MFYVIAIFSFAFPYTSGAEILIPSVSGNCAVDISLLDLSSIIINIVSDCMIFVLPLP